MLLNPLRRVDFVFMLVLDSGACGGWLNALHAAEAFVALLFVSMTALRVVSEVNLQHQRLHRQT